MGPSFEKYLMWQSYLKLVLKGKQINGVEFYDEDDNMDSGYSILSYNEGLRKLKKLRDVYDFYTIDEDFKLRLFLLHKRIRSPKLYEYWKTILTNELEQLVVSIKRKILLQFRLRQKRNNMWFH